MVLTFPRDLPDPPYFIATKLRIETVQALVPTSGATNPAADLGPAMWVAEPKTPHMPASGFRGYCAWHKSMRGAMRSFLMYDPDYKFPASSPGGSPSWGSPLVSAFDPAGGTITIKGMTPGYVLNAGDRMSIIYGTSNHYAMHEITAPATADGAGNLWVYVEPGILDGIAVDDVINFNRPKVEMTITPGSWEQMDGLGGAGSVSFSCIQKVRGV